MICSLFKKLQTKRWQMVLLLCSGIIVLYTLRVNMSVAAQDMRNDLGWSESEKGLVLSAFYWGYTFGMMPAAKLIQIYGAKWFFGFSVLIPSIFTILVPYVCRQSLGLALIIRVLIGFFESASFPAVYYFFPNWIPASEKTVLIPLVFSGMYLGEVIGFSLSGVLAESSIYINNQFYGGWPSIFYFFGTFGVLWFPVWAFFAHESPQIHPYISSEELSLFKTVNQVYKGKSYETYKNKDSVRFHLIENQKENELDSDIQDSIDKEENLEETKNSIELSEFKKNTKVEVEVGDNNQEFSSQEVADGTPWVNFVTNRVSVVLLFCYWVFGWISFTLLSETPSYLTDVLGFNLESAGFLSICPYFSLFFSNVFFGFFFNELIVEEDHFNTMNKNHSINSTVNPVLRNKNLQVELQVQDEVVKQIIASKYKGIIGYIRGQGWSVREARVAAHTTAYIGSGLALLMCGALTEKYAAYTFMVFSQFFFGATQAGLACAFTDVAPRYSSSLNSLANMMGSMAGILGPIIVALFTEYWPGGIWGWRSFFFLTGVLCVLSVGLFYLYVPCVIIPELNNPVLRKYHV